MDRIGGLPVFVPIMSKPELSIIIPTLNEAENLPLLLGDLERQKGLHFEVIVTDGGSADETSQFADDFFVAGRFTIVPFLKSHDEVKILEELDDELERSIKAIAYDENLSTIISGKNDIIYK